MKLICKMILMPVLMLLGVLMWICSGVLYVTAPVLEILSSLIGLLGIAVMLTYSFENGMTLILIAVLVSPVGIPIVMAKAVGLIENMRYLVKRRIFS